MAASPANSVTDPYLALYYAMQQHNVTDTYNLNEHQNAYAKQLADTSYSEKIAALDDKLNSENSTFRDSYANRGLLNSGIYNYGNAATPYANEGALQQFGHNWLTAYGNLANQKQVTDNSYISKGEDLTAQKTNQVNDIGQLSAADQARQVVSDSAKGVQ